MSNFWARTNLGKRQKSSPSGKNFFFCNVYTGCERVPLHNETKSSENCLFFFLALNTKEQGLNPRILIPAIIGFKRCSSMETRYPLIVLDGPTRENLNTKRMKGTSRGDRRGSRNPVWAQTQGQTFEPEEQLSSHVKWSESRFKV